MIHQTLITTSIILLPVFFVFHTTARPLKFEQPFWEIQKDPVPTPEDDPYGPVEVNTYVGNYFHPDGDYIHTDNRWPDLVPPAAVVRRADPAVVIQGPTATPDILAPWRPLCYHHCPPGVVHLPSSVGGYPYQRCHRCPAGVSRPSLVAGPSTTAVKDEMIAVSMATAVQKRGLARSVYVNEDLSLFSTTTVQSSTLTTTEEAAAVYTGAQQWQQYWAHDAAVSPVPTQGMLPVVEDLHPTLATTVLFSGISTTGEPTAISTGAEQRQAYWDHDAANPEVLTDEAKFALFAKVFAMPQRFTITIITFSEWLVQVDSQRKTQSQDTQEPGAAAIIAMCDMIDQIFPQDKVQEEDTGNLGTAITRTCKTLAQLYPQRKIQGKNAAPLDRSVIAKILNFFGELNETQTLDADTIRKEVFIDIMASIGGLNKNQIYDAGALIEGRIFNITAIRGYPTHRKVENRTESRNSSARQPRAIETHTEYANISPHTFQYQEDQGRGPPAPPSAPNVSPSASAHRPALAPRGMYMFQPLQEAYTWLNDMYTMAADQHPRWPYNPPDEDLYDCIYRPSPDNVAVDRIICPPGGRDGEQGLAARGVVEILKTIAQVLGIIETVEKRAAAATMKNRAVRGLFEAFFAMNNAPIEPVEPDETDKPNEPVEKRAVPVAIKKRFLWDLVKIIFAPHSYDEAAIEPVKKKRAAPTGAQKRSTWEYYKNLFYNTNMEAVEIAPVVTGEPIEPALIPNDPGEVVDPALVEPVEPNKPRSHEG